MEIQTSVAVPRPFRRGVERVIGNTPQQGDAESLKTEKWSLKRCISSMIQHEKMMQPDNSQVLLWQPLLQPSLKGTRASET